MYVLTIFLLLVPKNPNLTWAAPGVLRYLIVMLITGTFLWNLLMIIEYGLLKQVTNIIIIVVLGNF